MPKGLFLKINSSVEYSSLVDDIASDLGELYSLFNLSIVNEPKYSIDIITKVLDSVL